VSVEVKVCGLTRPEDARAALAAGADYLGIVFAQSRRRLDAPAARRLVAAAPGARWVGVFAGQPANAVRAAADGIGLRIVQLHGDEDPAVVKELVAAGLEVWQAVGVDDPPDWKRVARRLAELDGRVATVLLDRRADGRMGGGGLPIAWGGAPSALSEGLARSRLGLSGGLSAGNVGDALACIAADLVDASSALESQPGVKDAMRVRRFVEAARAPRLATPAGGSAP
jgi:phosphoribosylanthranilate isomerase